MVSSVIVPTLATVAEDAMQESESTVGSSSPTDNQ